MINEQPLPRRRSVEPNPLAPRPGELVGGAKVGYTQAQLDVAVEAARREEREQIARAIERLAPRMEASADEAKLRRLAERIRDGQS